MKNWLVPTLISTLIVILGGVGIYSLVSSEPAKSPGLGDWGDAFGALIATISFVWLIALHIDNSLRIRENQAEIVRTNERVEELLSVLSDISSSLARSAGAEAAQAAVAFQRMAPQFVITGNTAGGKAKQGITAAQPRDVLYAIRNDGFVVQMIGVRRLSGDVEVTIDRQVPFDCLQHHAFSISITSSRPLKSAGGFSFAISYRLQHGPVRAKKFSFSRFDQEAQVTDFQEGEEGST